MPRHFIWSNREHHDHCQSRSRGTTKTVLHWNHQLLVITRDYLRRLPRLLRIYPTVLQHRAFNHRQNWPDNYNAVILTSYILSSNCSNPQRNPLSRTCFCFSPVASTFFLKKWQDTNPVKPMGNFVHQAEENLMRIYEIYLTYTSLCHSLAKTRQFCEKS